MAQLHCNLESRKKKEDFYTRSFHIRSAAFSQIKKGSSAGKKGLGWNSNRDTTLDFQRSKSAVAALEQRFQRCSNAATADFEHDFTDWAVSVGGDYIRT